ncbi:MAG: hypothetical protein NW703_07185 [Nitrospiraceae bacterium]
MKRFKVWTMPALVLSVGLAACAGPKTTRSGEIQTVNIEKEPVPSDLVVNVGDEVRWENHRAWPVRLGLVTGNLRETLSCERGFSNFLGMKRDSAEIGPNESVSTCFSKVGVIKYNLRMESALPGGKTITSGTVQVRDPVKR